MKLTCSLAPSTLRIFPNDLPPARAFSPIDAALNERFSFQLAVRAEADAKVAVSASAPEGWIVRIRRVGLVPVPHHNSDVLANPLDLDGIGSIPGLVPDPLFDETSATLAVGETVSFWFTVTPPPDAKPGAYRIAATATPFDRGDAAKRIGRPVTRSAAIRLHPVRIAPRTGFDVTHWFYSDCIIQRYGTRLFDERYWTLLEAYLKDIAEHGQNVVYVPLFTPPLDTDKLPSQLLKVSRGKGGAYSLDWSDVRRYVRTARKCGIEKFEWSHFFSQWGCKCAIRIYEGQGETEKLLWPAETPATSETYRAFLSQLLPELRKFLATEKILGKSFFHVSDEPHGDEARANYKAARAMLRELAPWMKTMDALSQIEFAREGLVDTPVPLTRFALDFVKEGIGSWCYYCCAPREGYLQHLLDTPLAKVAMHGFLFYRWPFKGFLHWGLNYWNKCQTRIPVDPFTVADAGNWGGGWAYGDTFLVYPGPVGPIDSIRWEVFSEAMQDYALLQTLGVSPDDPLLAPIQSFSDFPKNARWRIAARRRLLASRVPAFPRTPPA